MLHPFIFLFGYLRIRIGKSDAARVVELLGRESRVYRNFTFFEDSAFFDISFFLSGRVLRLLEVSGIEASVYSRHGLPLLLWKYRKRYGVFVGILLFFLITFLSSRVIWDVRVIGNTTIDEAQIYASLSECGLRVGTPIRSIDTPVLENRILISSDDIAWISINIKGTVAEVEIIETVPKPEEADYESADLVAEYSGVIEWFEDTRGNALVCVGDTVSAGDVLVSGYYPADEEQGIGERYAVARGKVYARTVREFEVSIPLTYEKKEYTGEKKFEKYFILFEKEVKFFGNSRNLYANCDTINTVDSFTLPKNVDLPFGIRTCVYAEYRTVTAERSPQSATELALYTLRCRMADEVPEGMLMKKEIRGELRDGEYVLYCRAEYIENIAAVRERIIEK